MQKDRIVGKRLEEKACMCREDVEVCDGGSIERSRT